MRSMFNRRPNVDDEVELNPTPMGMRGFIPGTVLEQPLQFGGIIPSIPSNDFHRSESLGLYNSYKNRLNPDVSGPSNDVLDYQRYQANNRADRKINADINNFDLAREDRNRNAELDRKSREEIAKNNIEGRKVLQDDKQADKAALEKEKLDTVNKQKELNRKTIKDRAQQALDELNQLLDEKDQLTSQGQDAFGGVNNMISKLPWSTNSYDAGTRRDRLKNLLTLDLLGEMKAQSKSGATGFGQMNMKELGVLEGGASRIANKLSDKEAPGVLKDVRKYLNQILTDESSSQNFEVLLDPNNVPRRVPKDKVEEFLSKGGKRQ